MPGLAFRTTGRGSHWGPASQLAMLILAVAWEPMPGSVGP